MKKNFIIQSLLIIMLMSLIPNTTYAKQSIRILVDGKEIVSDEAPFIENGRTMVPVRFIGEALGLEVTFNKNYESTGPFYSIYAERGYATLTNKENGRFIGISDDIVSSDGISYSGGSAKIKNGRTFVPIRMIANALNLDVIWNKSSNTVSLNTRTTSPIIPIYITADGFQLRESKLYSITFKNGRYEFTKPVKYLNFSEDNCTIADFAKYVLENDLEFNEETLFSNTRYNMNDEGNKIEANSAQ
ncbi:Copper amine oxidase N-terminal domain-containing protein [Anaerosphaera aminiphila DSM 21120]|uniref:Copper amine oxidase N-terminal domain-containing protein n=1 Tax=Anaerosphaera aminiphila DSM 21120 TaxID=1120995 RepID=A0A1M5R261_9FIRM|nr:copper amine oxidase N-terminal domain-containing protein [Anaerosphaera aminiphila]SHH20515.1 Copper amine oxidase N-terminal domain-containing protein [Anaerosphaera aminiphila DSM 21120]